MRAPSAEAALLRNLSEHRCERSVLGRVVGRVPVGRLWPLAGLPARGLCRISGLGPEAPPVFIHRLCRGLRLRGRQRGSASHLRPGFRLFPDDRRRHDRRAVASRAPLREESMRAYTASGEEAVRTLDLLQDWRSEGLITQEQHGRMEQETQCELRRTNIFLRLVLFFFTVIIAGAAAGLFLQLGGPQDHAVGILLLLFAALCYAAAEIAVRTYRLYRYGIEEALAVCSVAFLCVGLEAAFFNGIFGSTVKSEYLVPTAGAIVSLWIWHRFGLVYAPLAA